MKQSQNFFKLKQKQPYQGAFSWFDGGADNEYITRHILSGLGHLEKLQADSISSSKIKAITKQLSLTSTYSFRTIQTHCF
jgi:hypothetical protein